MDDNYYRFHITYRIQWPSSKNVSWVGFNKGYAHRYGKALKIAISATKRFQSDVLIQDLKTGMTYRVHQMQSWQEYEE